LHLAHAFDATVVVPTYNRKQSIANAVSSCFRNDGLHVEVIVVDDGSTDGTFEHLSEKFDVIAADWRGPHTFASRRRGKNALFYFYQENSGACVARNFGLAKARGEFVKFLDSDDELIPQALRKEVDFARKTGTDVVVTGWEEKQIDKGNVLHRSVKSVKAPDLSAGIDAMLVGTAPWTSAALYRRENVCRLKWDVECTKAQDWMWAWMVCLEGLAFASLDLKSAVYFHHHETQRITGQKDSFLASTISRQTILGKVERIMREKGLLTTERKKKLATYLLKDRIVVCEQDPEEWKKLFARCKKLSDSPVVLPDRWSEKLLNRVLGVYLGVRVYVGLKKAFKFIAGSAT
jgi:glycosyltransferase involved in cell wall biosynthesis